VERLYGYEQRAKGKHQRKSFVYCHCLTPFPDGVESEPTTLEEPILLCKKIIPYRNKKMALSGSSKWTFIAKRSIITTKEGHTIKMTAGAGNTYGHAQ
jgi:hypothetical protein